MHETIHVEGVIERFPGKNGWHHIRLSPEQSADVGPLVRSTWPALLPVRVQAGNVHWPASLMPIKDGPVFIVVPAKIRKKHGLREGDALAVTLVQQTPS